VSHAVEGANEEEPESKPAKAKGSPKLSIPISTTQSESTQGDKAKATDKKRVAKTREELKKAREDKEKRRYAAHLEEKNKENTTTLTLPAGHAALRYACSACFLLFATMLFVQLIIVFSIIVYSCAFENRVFFVLFWILLLLVILF
jgi:Flp pilus assembly protein TadB